MRYKILRILAKDYGVWSLVKDYRDLPKYLKEIWKF